MPRWLAAFMVDDLLVDLHLTAPANSKTADNPVTYNNLQSNPNFRQDYILTS